MAFSGLFTSKTAADLQHARMTIAELTAQIEALSQEVARGQAESTVWHDRFQHANRALSDVFAERYELGAQVSCPEDPRLSKLTTQLASAGQRIQELEDVTCRYKDEVVTLRMQNTRLIARLNEVTEGHMAMQDIVERLIEENQELADDNSRLNAELCCISRRLAAMQFPSSASIGADRLAPRVHQLVARHRAKLAAEDRHSVLHPTPAAAAAAAAALAAAGSVNQPSSQAPGAVSHAVSAAGSVSPGPIPASSFAAPAHRIGAGAVTRKPTSSFYPMLAATLDSSNVMAPQHGAHPDTTLLLPTMATAADAVRAPGLKAQHLQPKHTRSQSQRSLVLSLPHELSDEESSSDQSSHSSCGGTYSQLPPRTLTKRSASLKALSKRLFSSYSSSTGSSCAEGSQP